VPYISFFFPFGRCSLSLIRLATVSMHSSSFLLTMYDNNLGFLCGFCNELWVVENGRVEVRHGDEFEEIFAIFKGETLSEAQGRSSVRNIKSAMAKQATKQRTTPKTGGFIG